MFRWRWERKFKHQILCTGWYEIYQKMIKEWWAWLGLEKSIDLVIFVMCWSLSKTDLNQGSFTNLLVCFYPTWLNSQINPQINLYFYWTEKDFENCPMTHNSENYKHLWVLLCSSQLKGKQITIYKLGSWRANNRFNNICCFWRLILCLLVGKSSFAFIMKPCNWLDRVKTHHFPPVFLVKWVRHFVFYKIIIQLHIFHLSVL